MTHFPKDKSANEGNTFTAIVTIVTDSQEHAEQVLTERLLHDEDYGFDYTVDYAELQPQGATRGIIFDASTIREELDDFIENAYQSDTLFSMNAELIRERVKNLSDAQINAIISSVDDSAVWEALSTMSAEVIASIINTVVFQWTADDESRLRLLESYGDALTDDETNELNDLMWRYAYSHWGLEALTDTISEDA